MNYETIKYEVEDNILTFVSDIKLSSSIIDWLWFDTVVFSISHISMGSSSAFNEFAKKKYWNNKNW